MFAAARGQLRTAAALGAIGACLQVTAIGHRAAQLAAPERGLAALALGATWTVSELRPNGRATARAVARSAQARRNCRFLASSPSEHHTHQEEASEMATTGTAKVINCEDGFVVRGANDDELIANAEAHLRAAHPDMVGQVTREQLLAMAVPAEA